MSIRGEAVIVGAYAPPRRALPARPRAPLPPPGAVRALTAPGRTHAHGAAYFCDSTAPGFGPVSMAEYLGVAARYVDSTETGGSSYLAHVGHAAAAIAAGKCRVALITLAGRPRTGGAPAGGAQRMLDSPEAGFEQVGLSSPVGNYALAASRHMHEFGTTSEQLAWIKVAASEHAQHNPHALLPTPVTVDDVLGSPLLADPLHRLDCCVVTDGGGAVVVVHPDVARSLGRAGATVLGHGEAVKHADAGRIDLTYSAARWSGPAAFAEAGVTPDDIQYASIYDSFTITVLIALEDLGFCEKGQGGGFVADGALRSPGGRLPFNTDGGGLCNNHPANRGGMTKIIEAVRQLRGEAHPAVQVPGCELALAHGTGGALSTRHGSATLVLGAYR